MGLGVLGRTEMEEQAGGAWMRADNGVWHRVLAWVRWGNDATWSSLTACQASLERDTFDEDGQEAPGAEARCRKCSVADVVRVP